MNKKYQVFISSTYEDLKDERMAVTQCLLDIGCIPVGMEQFPASNMSQMEYIEKMLDDCDYYILILAGKYGTIDLDGVSFTEKEYDYAIKKGIPVMSFVAENISKLESEKCECKDRMRKKLCAFRSKVCKDKMVNFYSDIGALKAQVVVSMNRCVSDYPAVGWIRGNSIDGSESVKEQIQVFLETIDNELSKIYYGTEEPKAPKNGDVWIE